MPERIQLRRTKGWRKPDGAVYVGRPGAWGNPYIVKPSDRPNPRCTQYWDVVDRSGVIRGHAFDTRAEAVAHAVEMHRRLVIQYEWPRLIRAELAGKDLACWCGLDQPCHADVLLEIANGGDA